MHLLIHPQNQNNLACNCPFSDGYADQFGRPKGKKFKHSGFNDLLFAIQPKPMSEQKELLSNGIEKWWGDLEQVDDVCIIGISML